MSFILPVIDYCDTVWNCCGKVNSDNLEKLHRRAARLIIRNHCSDAALQSLAMESLENRRKKTRISLCNKVYDWKVSTVFYKLFQLQSGDYGTSDTPEQPIAPPSSTDRSGKKVIFLLWHTNF